MKKTTFKLIATSIKETQTIGENIGRLLEEEAVITLSGDLASGKTTFVQGLARGLEVPPDYYVTSPTYNIINEYPGRIQLFHIDLYRLSGVEDLEDLGFEEILESGSVIAIEWASKAPNEMLAPFLEINIEQLKEDEREFSIIAYGLKASNLIKNSIFDQFRAE